MSISSGTVGNGIVGNDNKIKEMKEMKDIKDKKELKPKIEIKEKDVSQHQSNIIKSEKINIVGPPADPRPSVPDSRPSIPVPLIRVISGPVEGMNSTSTSTSTFNSVVKPPAYRTPAPPTFPTSFSVSHPSTLLSTSTSSSSLLNASSSSLHGTLHPGI